MIDMQVGAKHRIDRIPWVASLCDIIEKRAGPHVPAWDRPNLVISEASINHNAPILGLDNQCVNAHNEATIGIREVRS